MRSLRLIFSAALVLGCATAQQITKPEAFFGHQLGADRTIARWDKMVDYINVLEQQSGGRMKVVNAGKTSEGNPFLVVYISSAANLSNIARYKEINQRLTDPRGMAEAEARTLAKEGRAVVASTSSMHATEIGGEHATLELAYDLLTNTDEDTKRILDNVIYIMVPCFNPDGNIIVGDWYRSQLGTPSEGSAQPVLYQKYAGHDNNRDGFAMNLPDSKYFGKVIYKEMTPQAYYDLHHMGTYGARIFVPPYADPIRPFADPLVWREMQYYGGHMSTLMEQAGQSGVLTYAQYSGWGHWGWHWITPFHNIGGMLTESASARLATPVYISQDELDRGATARNYKSSAASTIFPNPWKPGVWRLRDIVDRQKLSTYALLDAVAKDKYNIVYQAYLKASRQTARGAENNEGHVAYIISANQHDAGATNHFVNLLLQSNVQMLKATASFQTAEGMTYPAGTLIVPTAQPKSGLIRYVLYKTFYIINEYTVEKDGTPIRPYDKATDTMMEAYNTRVDYVHEMPQVATQPVTEPIQLVGKVTAGTHGYSMDGRMNKAFEALNQLFDKGVPVKRVDKAQAGLRPGDFLIASSVEASVLEPIAKHTGVNFRGVFSPVTNGTHDLKRQRIALYQRYGGGNMEEGWARFVFEEFGFPYTSVFDKEIQAGNLNAKYDVFIIPNDSTATLTGPAVVNEMFGPAQPPEFRANGMGKEGIQALRSFVQNGGTLVTIDGATNFAADRLGVGVRNVMSSSISTKQFWCPGSHLRVEVDNTQPIAYGMPSEALALHLQATPALEIMQTNAPTYKIAAKYVDRDLLESGWLVGEQYLAGKAAVITAGIGKGTHVLAAVPIPHRAQNQFNYKFLFNALVPMK